MKVRLADIAERAGVSVSTVSRVLNEKPGVNDLTRRQVLTALDVLGYDRPSRLRGRTADLVGVIVPELENPVFPAIAQAVETNLAKHGFTPVLCTQSLGGVHEDDYVQMLLDHGVSGIIFVSGIHAIGESDPARYLKLVELKLPFVFINGYHPAVPAVSLSVDDAAGIELAVTHLAHMGHRRIGLAMGQPRYTPSARKAAAFLVALRRQVPGLDAAEAESLVEYTTYTVEGGTLAGTALLQRGVTAVVAGSDVMALGVIRAVRAAGRRVPEDVSVVGSDDSMLNDFTHPPLTSIRAPAATIAKAACTSLLDQIAAQPVSTGDRLFPPELVVRESTGPVRKESR